MLLSGTQEQYQIHLEKKHKYMTSTKVTNNVNCMRGSRGARGVRTPTPRDRLKKTIGYLRNTDPDPLGNHKFIKQAFNVGPSSTRQQTAI